jgi:hypothetical protein
MQKWRHPPNSKKDSQSKHFKKMKIDNPVENLLDAWKRPDSGLSSIFAGGLMYGLPMIFFSGLHFFYMSFMEKSKRLEYFEFMFLLYVLIWMSAKKIVVFLFGAGFHSKTICSIQISALLT